MLSYVQTLLVQACQSAGCNSHHKLAQRLPRWLLSCADRSETDTMVVTQEYLAEILGSTRSTVSVAAEHLQQERLIQYTRGKVVILERPGLERRSCECCRLLKNHLDNYMEVEQD